MANLNKAMLIGRLGREPESKYTPNGTAVVTFSLATSEKQKDKDPVTEWHRIVAFGRLAEICGEHLRKGSEVYVEGKLRARSWEDREGSKHSTTEIVITQMQMLGEGKKKESREPGDEDDVPWID